jgi:hypothetical protein
VILQHRQGRTLVLAIGPPRAGLDTLTEVGVRCVKEVVVVSLFLGKVSEKKAAKAGKYVI